MGFAGNLERVLLSDRDIKAEIESGRVGIDPYLEAMVQPSSIDVRLDRFFRVFENHKYPHIDPAAVNDRIADPNGAVQKFIDAQQDNVFRVSVQALGVLFQGFTVLLFSFYLVADGPRLRRSICSRLRPERQRAVLDRHRRCIHHRIDRR